MYEILKAVIGTDVSPEVIIFGCVALCIVLTVVFVDLFYRFFRHFWR